METKEKILKVAEDLFSKVSFDGARVDEIAQKAGVNKASIYYYFDSKQEILETLLANLVEDTRKMLISAMADLPDVGEGDGYRQLFNVYIRFVSQNRKLIKVAVAESIKSEASPSVLIQLGNLIINAEITARRKEYERKGLHFPDNQQKLLVMEFFTGLTPFLSYALYKDQWEAQYDISEEDLQELLYQSFRDTHLAAHLPK